MRQLVNGPEARKGKATGIQGERGRERETDREKERVSLHKQTHTNTHTRTHTLAPFSILSLCLAQLLPFFLDNTWPA